MADRPPVAANVDGPVVAAGELEGQERCGSLVRLVMGWEEPSRHQRSVNPDLGSKAPDTFPTLAT